jgi:single-strand DNA-binding protein
MLNTVSLIGRLAADPTVRQTQAGVVVSFRLAVQRPTKDKTADFFNVTAFGKTAEYIQNYVTKGRLVVVNGRLEVNAYTNKEGVNVQVVQVVANTVNALERGDDAPQGNRAAPASTKGQLDDIADPFGD